MYQIIKDVINSGRYELNDILKKIDTIWVQGDLTDDEKAELVELARTNADPAQTYAPLREQIDQAFAQIKALDARVKALEAGEAPEPSPEPDEWPALGGLEAVQEGNDTFNAWLRKMKAIDRELYSLYQARDFQGMVEAVVNLPDPGN